MFPHADTYYAAVATERMLELTRAERRALLSEAAKKPRPALRLPARTATISWGRLGRAVQGLRRVPRPAHA